MFDIEEDSNRKTRKHRVKNLKKFGLDAGKLYKFNGRYRKVYRTRQPNISYQERLENNYKIHRGDHLIFFFADLWVVSATKKARALPKKLDLTKKRLEANGKKIIRTEGCRMSGSRWRTRWIRDDINPKYYFIFYKELEEKFSGRLYIGHGDKFGWINIVQMTKEKILSQFQKVDI